MNVYTFSRAYLRTDGIAITRSFTTSAVAAGVASAAGASTAASSALELHHDRHL